MKRFEIITESDARLLDAGATVVLARGGHVTPLAADTLRAMRVTVVREDQVTGDESALVPVSAVRRIAIGGDHNSLALKTHLIQTLRGRGFALDDRGTSSSEPVDYPDVAAEVARAVARQEADAGIVIDGSGIGSAIAANKVAGIRAAVCHDVVTARYSREHNGANVLCLGATMIEPEAAGAVAVAWLHAHMTEARYVRRLVKIQALERQRRER